MPKEEKGSAPRWNVIERLHDKIDKCIDSALKKDNLSIIEIDFALLMIHEKVNQQKMELYNIYFKQRDEDTPVESKDAPANVYG